MITLKQLAEKIQCELNDNISEYHLNEWIPNVNFKFNVYLNAGEYKKAKREDNSNVVTYYINAIMKVLSSEIEGESDVLGTYNASMTTSIEFLIPFSERKYDLGISSDTDIRTFSDQVHHMISSLLQAGFSDSMNDGKEDYLVGSRFTIPSPGAKEIRALVGESISLTIYGTHYFIASGVNSNKIKLSIENNTVFASRIGIARTTITEGNIFSGTDSSSKNTISGTALTITFDAPLKIGGYNEIIGEYLLGTAQKDILNVTLTLPHSETAKTFYMIIADAGMNGELGLAASVNVRLIEAMDWGEQSARC